MKCGCQFGTTASQHPRFPAALKGKEGLHWRQWNMLKVWQNYRSSAFHRPWEIYAWRGFCSFQRLRRRLVSVLVINFKIGLQIKYIHFLKSVRSLSSQTILRLSLGSWSSFSLMYFHMSFTTCGLEQAGTPTTSANSVESAISLLKPVFFCFVVSSRFLTIFLESRGLSTERVEYRLESMRWSRAARSASFFSISFNRCFSDFWLVCAGSSRSWVVPLASDSAFRLSAKSQYLFLINSLICFCTS